MKILPLVVLFGLLLIPSCDPVNQSSQILSNDSIRDLLTETITDEEIPGIIAAIVDENGIRRIEAAGVRKLGSTTKLTVDDLIHLGSCTKAMTSTLLGTLVERGELTWQTTLIEVFPELKDIVHADYHPITLHQLVTHRAGVPTNAKNWWLFQDLEIKERRVAMIKDNLTEPSLLAQGDYSYSNLGYMIAGSMAEKVTGSSWERLMKDRLFDPLAMTTAGFGVPGTMGQTNQPWGHLKSGGTWQPIQADNAEALGPAGTVHCTFEDWAKYISLQYLKNEPVVLDRKQIDFLMDPIGEYASGWGVFERKWANGTVLTHSGSNTMWLVTAWVAPEINRAFIVGMNSFDADSYSISDKIIGKLIEFDQSQ